MPRQSKDRDPQREPERYPSVRQDDAVERTGSTEEVAGERAARARDGRRLGPVGDPAEGKRR